MGCAGLGWVGMGWDGMGQARVHLGSLLRRGQGGLPACSCCNCERQVQPCATCLLMYAHVSAANWHVRGAAASAQKLFLCHEWFQAVP